MATIVRWLARIAGIALIALHAQNALYEGHRLIVQKWAYGERMFSVAFLAMLVGVLVGWRSDRMAAAIMIPAYLLAVATLFMSRFVRPELGADPQGVALALLPFLAVGLAFAYAGRRWSSLL